MKLAVAFAISAMCVYALAQYATPRRIIRTSTSTSPTYLVKQDFEGTGYDNSESWTESGTVDEDYATSPAPLVGSQSCYLDGSAASASTYAAFSAKGEVWAFFTFNLNNGPFPASSRQIFTLRDEATIRATVAVNTSGKLRVYNGSSYAETTGTITTNGTYNVWFYYKKGTGTNGISNVGFSSDTTKPTSGNNYKEVTNGDSTTDVSRVYIQAQNSSSIFVSPIFDKVRVDDVEIGSSPE